MAQPSNGPGGRTLSRDFKHVKRHATTRGQEAFGGWTGFGAGLAIGLSVALAVFMHYRVQPASVAAEPQAKPETAPKSDVANDETTVAGTTTDLDFYDMLQNQQVEVPSDPAVKPGPGKARGAGGAAMLQAGSFKQSAEAEKRVAQLATLGITARLSRFAMDDETWYRVLIGPIETAKEFDEIRNKLEDAEIEAAPAGTIDQPPPP